MERVKHCQNTLQNKGNRPRAHLFGLPLMWIWGAWVFLIALIAASSEKPPADNDVLAEATRYCRTLPSMAGHDDCWIANATWVGDTDMNAAKQRVLGAMMKRSYPKSNSSSVFVYIHAMASRDNMAGPLILEKILSAVEFTGLVHRATGIYAVLFGDIAPLRFVLKQYEKVTIISSLKDLGKYFEFSTLTLMQYHAFQSHPDSKFLYMHTKGVTHFEDQVRSYIRTSMIYFNVYLYEQAIALLSIGWEAAGIMFVASSGSEDHYAGNYFWVKGSTMMRNVNVRDLVWHWRFGAERWPLSSIPRSCTAFKSNFTSNVMWLSFLVRKTPKDIGEFVANMEPPNVNCADNGFLMNR